MEHLELIKWAVKGITSEIAELEKSINHGKQLLVQYEKGQTPKTPKTPQEIKEIIRKKKADIEALDKQRFNLQWELTLAEDEKKQKK